MSSQFNVLVVCSGNTCRSPLAAAMLAAQLANDPRFGNVDVTSAGTSAWEGSPASEGSYLVALELGLDLSGHRARLLTGELVATADRILTMTKAHADRVAALGGGDKVVTIVEYAGGDPEASDIPDPFGAEVSAYRETASALQQLLGAVADHLSHELKR